MRVVAFSDSHGKADELLAAVRLALRGGRIDVCVHCGDGMRDMDGVEPALREANPDVRIYTVAGNCDLAVIDPVYAAEFTADGVRMLAVHGDKHSAKQHYGALVELAQRRGAAVLFFGHTHRPFLEAEGGVYLINPGAVERAHAGRVAYAQAVVDGGSLRADLVFWPR